MASSKGDTLEQKIKDMELVFTKDGITIKTPINLPLIGDAFHEETIGYDKLPANGITITITSIDKTVDAAGKLTALIFRVSSYEMPKVEESKPEPTKAEFALTESSLKYHLIHIYKHRKMFPGYKVLFLLETNKGSIATHVSSAPRGAQKGDPSAGYYIQANLKKWFDAHPELKVGDRVLIEAIEKGKRYNLKLLSS